MLAGAGFAAIAVALSLRYRLGHAREIADRRRARRSCSSRSSARRSRSSSSSRRSRSRSSPSWCATAGLTAGSRLRGLPGARARALVSIAIPALAATGALLAVGAFELTARSAVPIAGILIGGAMAATTLTGRRLLESLHDDAPEIETRLALGDERADGARARPCAAPSTRASCRSSTRPAASAS